MVSYINGRTQIIVIGNEVITTIFEPRRDKVTPDWRKFHNKEIHSTYYSPNIRLNRSSTMRWAGHIAHMWKIKNEYKYLYGCPGGRDQLETPTISLQDTTKIDPSDVVFWGTGWIQLAQDRD